MLIDYSNQSNRDELLLDIQPLLCEYVRNQMAQYIDDDMSIGRQASELGKIMRYLDDNLTIEFKELATSSVSI